MKLSALVAIAAVIGGSFLIPMPAEAESLKLRVAVEKFLEQRDKALADNPPFSDWPQPEKVWEHVDRERLRQIKSGKLG